MKSIPRFILYTVISVACLFIILLSAGSRQLRMVWAYVANADEYAGRAATIEIMPYIDKVQTSDEYTKLIVGDSVCCQIFNQFQDCNDVFALAGSNDAVTVPGQYLLITEFLKSHPGTTDVYLITRSFSGNGFRFEPWAYQYLVIPFSEAGLLQGLDDNTMTDLKKIYGGLFLNKRVVREVDRNPVLNKIYINSLGTNEYDNDTMTIQYLNRIVDACDAAGARFHLAHNPVPESNEDSVNRERDMVAELVKGSSLEQYVTDYYNSVIYYEDAAFGDGFHFDRQRYDREQFAEVIGDMSLNIVGLSDIQVNDLY